jgi:hypothetical protein
MRTLSIGIVAAVLTCGGQSMATPSQPGVPLERVSGLARDALHQAARMAQRAHGLTLTPSFAGRDDPAVYVRQFKTTRSGSELHIVATQPTRDYAGDVIKLRSGAVLKSLTASAVIRIDPQGNLRVEKVALRKQPGNLATMLPLDGTMKDAARTALRQVAPAVQAQKKLSLQPTFEGKVDPKVSIHGFQMTPDGPTLSLRAEQAAFDHAGSPLQNRAGVRQNVVVRTQAVVGRDSQGTLKVLGSQLP